MLRRYSLTWPIVVGVVLLTLIVALLVIWIIGLASQQQWSLLIVGMVFFVLVLLGVVFYFVLSIKQVSLNRQQGNFIDAVTHELKSPIASLKLCLQTLDLRNVSPEQQREFHRFMLEDVQRLDALIDHLLTAAELGHGGPKEGFEEIPLEPLLKDCAETVRRRYNLQPEQIRLETTLTPCYVQGTEQDLEMVFSNLLDNGVKYGGKTPEVLVRVQAIRGGTVQTSISDNGKGVRFEFRRRIFDRFFRGGTELERTTKGTGLGLFIVRSLVRRMKGHVHVHGRGPLRGATFEVELPGRMEQKLPDVFPPQPATPAAPTAESQGAH